MHDLDGWATTSWPAAPGSTSTFFTKFPLLARGLTILGLKTASVSRGIATAGAADGLPQSYE